MSNKKIAAGTLLVLIAFLAVSIFTATSFLQTINPIAALSALTIALIGIVWFKKSCH